MNFTYDSYRSLIRHIKESGYSITTFERSDDIPEPKVILRHDVDLSPEKAVVLSKLERQEKVTATYFFLVTSDFYNIFDKANRKAVEEIKRDGHEIGLHFDLSQYDCKNNSQLEDCIYEETVAFFVATGETPKSISWHIPPKGLLGKEIEFLNGIKNAYDPVYFYGYKYLSDSNMNWREDPYRFINKEQYPKLQILTHPIWYGETEREKNEILKEEKDRKQERDTAYIRTISPF